MKEQKKEQGITLVALVVTIIILLILAGVTLNIALSENGIFEKAKEAVEKYKNAEEDEVNVLDSLAEQLKNINIDYEDYVGATVTGYNPITKTCTIETITSGHTEAQTFTTDPMNTGKTGMQWRVWDFDGNTLRIIGDPTEKMLTLSGAAGYNNGLWAINEICNKCYSNGKEGIKISNLKRSDIQKISTYDYTKYKHKGNEWEEIIGDSSENLIYYGETKTYEINNKYPQLWGDKDQKWKYGYDSKSNEKTGVDQEGKTWEELGTDDGLMSSTMVDGSNTITFKQSYYAHVYEEKEFPNNKYYDLIFKKADNESIDKIYWLGGRYVFLGVDYCLFGLQNVNSKEAGKGIVLGNTLCRSYQTNYPVSCAIRPVVSINLKDSGCTINPIVGEDGNIEKCELSWNTKD